MTEYFIAYDETSGAELFRGSGPAGTAAEQVIEGGPAIMMVPREAVTSAVTNLAPIKTAMKAMINTQANALFASLITDISGQARRYMLKLDEARAWAEGGDSAAYPFLTAEAEARGMTIVEVRDGILAQYAASVQAEAAIEAARVKHRAALDAATGLVELAEAGKVDWNAVTGKIA